MKTVTFFSTLMFYATEMGKAEQEGRTEDYEHWKKAHDSYQRACLASDEMVIGTRGETYG